MKKRFVLTLVIAIAAVAAMVGMAGCTAKFNPDATITIVSREEGSGTRSGFDDIVGLRGDVKLDRGATILSSTGAVMTKVNTSPVAIGYISLGSYNDTVKLVKIGGVIPNATTVKDGTYALQRNFNIVTKNGATMSGAAQDFITFMLSSKGQAVVKTNKYVELSDAPAYTTAKNSVTDGNLAISGSSSVSPLMLKLKDAYALEQSGVKITINTTDSGSGVSDVTNATDEKAPNTIGMISREAKSSESAVVSTKIAIDGIAVIVNNKNTLEGLTLEQLKNIYTGTITKYSEVIK